MRLSTFDRRRKSCSRTTTTQQWRRAGQLLPATTYRLYQWRHWSVQLVSLSWSATLCSFTAALQRHAARATLCRRSAAHISTRQFVCCCQLHLTQFTRPVNYSVCEEMLSQFQCYIFSSSVSVSDPECFCWCQIQRSYQSSHATDSVLVAL